MQIFLTAFKNTIIKMKSTFTPFFFILITILTILSFVIPIDISGNTTPSATQIIISIMSFMSSMAYLTNYLIELAMVMDKTKFKKHSILNLFVKRVDDKYHLYTNIFIIVLISIILSIIIAVMTNMIFPIMITFIFMGMFILLSI